MFDNPKDHEVLARLISYMTSPADGDIVLDFFAGSAPTAHAVLELARSSGGRRSFMLVQLPEPVNPNSNSGRNALSLGLKTIADIGKERIRRAIGKLKEEANGQGGLFEDRQAPEDLGFRVFMLAESNYRQWRGVEVKNGENYGEEMDLFTDPLLPGWRSEDVIWEVVLKEGYSLSCRIEEHNEIEGNRVWQVTDGGRGQSFLICLDEELKDAMVTALNLGTDDLFICRDAALTDEQAANLALTCRLKTI